MRHLVVGVVLLWSRVVFYRFVCCAGQCVRLWGRRS